MFLHLRFVIFFFNLIANCFGVLAETRLGQGVQIRQAALVHKRLVLGVIVAKPISCA